MDYAQICKKKPSQKTRLVPLQSQSCPQFWLASSIRVTLSKDQAYSWCTTKLDFYIKVDKHHWLSTVADKKNGCFDDLPDIMTISK